MLGFLQARAIPGVETVADGAYTRTDAAGTVHVRFDPAGPALLVDAPDAAIARVHRVFDPEGDQLQAAKAHLADDPLLAPLIARRHTLRAVAEAALADPTLFTPPATPDHRARLLAIPGIGPWSAEYILLRGFRDPDAFPASDVALLRMAASGGVRPSPAALAARAERWRPWRAYAAQHLWAADSPC